MSCCAVFDEFGCKKWEFEYMEIRNNDCFFSFNFVQCKKMPELSDNNNINIFDISGEIYATGETCFFRDIDPDTLKSENKYDTNKFFGLQMASAHPLTDEDGTTYNVGCSLLAGLKYSVRKIFYPHSIFSRICYIYDVHNSKALKGIIYERII